MDTRIDSAFCLECNAPTVAWTVSGAKIYPHRPDLDDLAIVQCFRCKNYVSTHPNGSPKGPIGNARIRKMRREAYLMAERWRNLGDPKVAEEIVEKTLKHLGWSSLTVIDSPQRALEWKSALRTVLNCPTPRTAKPVVS